MATTTLSQPVIRSSRTQLYVALIIGIICALLAPSILISAFFLYAATGSYILLIFAQKRPQHKEYLQNAAAWFPVLVLVSNFVIAIATALTPHTIDRSLDFGVARVFYRWGLSHPSCSSALGFIYLSLPVAMAASIGTSIDPRRAVKAMLKAAVIATPLYVAFPAAGPYGTDMHAGPHNCVPSLHATWAFLCMFYASPKLRGWLIPFVVLTVIATLTTGQHYVVDLVAAIPVVALCIWSTV